MAWLMAAFLICGCRSKAPVSTTRMESARLVETDKRAKRRHQCDGLQLRITDAVMHWRRNNVQVHYEIRNSGNQPCVLTNWNTIPVFAGNVACFLKNGQGDWFSIKMEFERGSSGASNEHLWRDLVIDPGGRVVGREDHFIIYTTQPTNQFKVRAVIKGCESIADEAVPRLSNKSPWPTRNTRKVEDTNSTDWQIWDGGQKR
jgi:hypothetical protein